MSHDNFVKFPKGKKPTQAELEPVLRDYLGAAAISIAWEPGTSHCAIVSLHGTHSFPFASIHPEDGRIDPSRPRFFEVFVGKKSDTFSVITRQADEFTNVVATGFAALAARYWGGEMDFDE